MEPEHLPSRLREGAGEGLSKIAPSLNMPSPNPSRKREGDSPARQQSLGGTRRNAVQRVAPKEHQPFFRISSAAAVIASVAVAITVSASGAQKGLWSDGNLVGSPPAASHFALGTPPTQKSRL